MADLTIIIITRNEEQNLRKCIESFRGIAKRFVIVDSFSTDGTRALCEKLDRELRLRGSRLDFYQNKWINYAAQFNWALDNTDISTEWSLRFDADEELTPELAREIARRLPRVKKPVNGIILRRRVYFMGRWIKHGGRYPEMLLRIFRTGKAMCEKKLMDEHLILSEGRTITFKYDFIDNNQKSLEWWTAKHNWYSNREVLEYQKLQKRSKDLDADFKSSTQALIKRIFKNGIYYKLPKFWRAHLYFIYRYYIRLGFLDGDEGRMFHFLQAYWYRFLVDAKLYECEKFGIVMEEQGALEAGADNKSRREK